jgi:hypothetical protein
MYEFDLEPYMDNSMPQSSDVAFIILERVVIKSAITEILILSLRPEMSSWEKVATFEHLAGITSLAFVLFLFTGFVTEVPLITLPFSFTALLGSVVVLFVG